MKATPTLFLTWRDIYLTPRQLAGVIAASGLVRALAFMRYPQPPALPFPRRDEAPRLTLELGFGDFAALEKAAAGFARGRRLPPGFTAEAMLGRRFATPDPVCRSANPCTLLVAYPGTAENLEAWLDHYDAHHPALMVRFPGVRDVATFRPLPEARLPKSWARDTHMQRNKVVFDSPEALAAALVSPVMLEMRADLAGFPPFTGAPTHAPAITIDAEANGAPPTERRRNTFL